MFVRNSASVELLICKIVVGTVVQITSRLVHVPLQGITSRVPRVVLAKESTTLTQLQPRA